MVTITPQFLLDLIRRDAGMQKAKETAKDVATGVARTPGNLAGSVVDLIKMVAPKSSDVGSSKWINQKLGIQEPKTTQGQAAEILSSFISPETLAAKVGSLGAAAGVIRKHGTARDFDKFSLEFLRSGEGANSFGSGIYTTEKLGEHYANVAYAANKARNLELAYNINSLKSLLRNYYNPGLPATKLSRNKVVEQLASMEKEYAAAEAPLRKLVLTVDIPDQYYTKYINYDAPLTKQSPEVTEVIKKLAPSLLKPEAGEATGENFYNILSSYYGGDFAASQLLSSKGIKGHYYFDQKSRAAKQGTVNDVTYDPEILKIISRKEIK